MTSVVIRQLLSSEFLRLLPILAFAFYIAFIPHVDYKYPVHADEWGHLTYAKAVQESGSIDFPEPLPWPLYSTDFSDPEIGYHVFLSMFQEVTDIQWMPFFRYFSGVVFVLAVLAVYTLARREGYGWPAALATCLIPTTVGILGPAFMVPMSMGIAFIPLCLFLAFNFQTKASYLLLFIFTSALLVIHPPTVIGLVIILIPYILLNLRNNFGHSLKISMAIGAPFLVPLVLAFDGVVNEIDQLLAERYVEDYISYPDLLRTYGYIPVALGFFGIIILAARGTIKNFGFVLGMFALILILLVFYRLHIGSSIWYDRGLIYSLLMLSVLAGAGLHWIKSRSFPNKSGGGIRNFFAKHTGIIVYASLVIIIVAITIPNRLDTSYYHMIDDEDYERFVWIRDNIDEDHEIAAVDPWKGTAMVAISEKSVVSRIHALRPWRAEITEDFLDNECKSTDFLTHWDASLVYNQSGCNNPDLVEVSENIYILRETER